MLSLPPSPFELTMRMSYIWYSLSCSLPLRPVLSLPFSPSLASAHPFLCGETEEEVSSALIHPHTCVYGVLSCSSTAGASMWLRFSMRSAIRASEENGKAGTWTNLWPQTVWNPGRAGTRASGSTSRIALARHLHPLPRMHAGGTKSPADRACCTYARAYAGLHKWMCQISSHRTHGFCSNGVLQHSLHQPQPLLKLP